MMATFKCINIDGATLYLNIEKVVWVGETDEDGVTPVRIDTGETLKILEDRDEMLEDWGAFSCAENVTNEPKKQ